MSFNPFDMQKQMFAEFEKNLGEYVQKTMREPTFMKLVAKNMATNLDVRTVVKKQLEKMLHSLDVPTQESMANLYRTVHDLETRMLDLEEKIEDLEDELAVLKKKKPAAVKEAKPKAVAKKAPAKKAPAKKAKAKKSAKKAPAKKTAAKKRVTKKRTKR